ncbi:hypothetical protein Ddc_05532 [Ditylenchus destructor]|nr:hypothetical protein Ddc_05532 [Ditylenchus destructor]
MLHYFKLTWTLWHIISQVCVLIYLYDILLITSSNYFFLVLCIGISVNTADFVLFAIFLIHHKSIKERFDAKFEIFVIFYTPFSVLATLANLSIFVFAAIHIFEPFANGSFMSKELQSKYGANIEFTLAFDRIHEKGQCCGMQNSVYEFRHSKWFENEIQSPTRTLPLSCEVKNAHAQSSTRNIRLFFINGCLSFIQWVFLAANTFATAQYLCSVIIQIWYNISVLYTQSNVNKLRFAPLNI